MIRLQRCHKCLKRGIHTYTTQLESRGLLQVAGPDAAKFLQGLISNDIGLLSRRRMIYTAILNAPVGLALRYPITGLMRLRRAGCCSTPLFTVTQAIAS
jgi:hypothetical protein